MWLPERVLIGRQSAAGDDAMDMVMTEQVRSPGVQDREESDLGAQMLGISSHFEQGLGAGFKDRFIPGDAQPVIVV